MRTTIELPDVLMTRAKSKAALDGRSLREFFIEAVEQKLNPPSVKTRTPPPAIGSAKARKIKSLTKEQVDEAMFG